MNQKTGTVVKTKKPMALGGGRFRAVVEDEPLLFCDKGAEDIVAVGTKEVTYTSPRGFTIRWSFEGADEIREKDLLPGVDMAAEKSSFTYKENLIFKKPEAVRPITVHLRHEGLKLEREGNACLLKDPDGEIIFILPEPFCEDQSENGAPAPVDLSIAEDEKEVSSLTYVMPADWLAEAVFPVTLDPTVITKNTRNVIQDAYTCSKEPNTVHNGGSSNIIRLTKDFPKWGQCDLYFRFGNDVLPDLKPSDIVTRATLVVTTAGANYPTASFSCTLHEVTSSWTPGTLTWNNAPTCSSEGRDIGHFVYHEGDGQTHVFDVTSLVRKWYQGVNYGVKLTATTNNIYAQFRSRAHGVASQRPYIVIDYISRSGMDSYLAFDGFDMGRAGAAHVNLFNGNLVYTHQDTVTNGQRMPVSVSHAWNACFADRNWFGLGLGWSCTGNHILWKETISNVVYYAWQDGSGTIRYFVQQSGVWKEELGREWTLTLGTTEATIEDKAGTKLVFGLPTVEFNNTPANAKTLIRIEDPRNNQAAFATSGLSLTGITDGANRGTTIELTNGLLSGIRAPGHVDTNDKISYSYTGSKLTGITYEDALSAVYGYDAHDLLASVTGVDGLIMEISYLNNAPWRVSSITAGTGTTLGGDRQIVRGKSYAYGDNLTTVTDLMTGKSLRYHFSDAGQLVALTDELGFGLFSRFPASGAIDQPEAVSRMQKSVRSLVRNPLMRDDGTWTKELYGATGSFSYDTATTKFAVSSVKADKTSVVGMLCISQTLVVLPGETATFSAWAKTSGDAQAKLLIRYNLPTDTDWHLIEGDAVSSPDDWTRLEVTFTIPAEATVGTIVGMMYTTGGIGSAWWDGAQCVHGTTPGRLNLLNNSNFTFSTADWSDAAGSGLTVHSVASDTTAPAEIGSNMVRFTGTPDGAVSFVQQINVKGSQGDCFTAGGWSQAHSVPRGTKTERYRAYIAFQNTSGGWVEGGKVLWSEGWSGWHLAAEAIIAPCDYIAIMFSIHYYDNCNEANFTGLFLHQEEFGQSFSYDSKGNIIAATDLAKLQDAAEYDDFSNLTQWRGAGKGATEVTTITYGATDAEKQRRLPLTITSPMGTVTTNTYNTHGGQLTQTVSGGGLTTSTSSEWNGAEDGFACAADNYVVKETDARGGQTCRAFDLDRGTVVSVTDPRGQAVSYQYDARLRMTEASTPMTTTTSCVNNYTYDQDRLDQVSHNTGNGDVVYTFGYDSFGRPTTVDVGGGLLSTTAYNAQGQTASVTYANGGQVAWTYDAFGRVVGVTVDNAASPRYTYTYGDMGEICEARDSVLQEVTRSGYDLSNRPRRKTILRAGQHHYTGEVSYDACGRLSAFSELVGAARTPFETTFVYDAEDRPTTIQFGAATRKTVYGYDSLGRMTQQTLTLPSGCVQTSYGYLPGAGTSTTPLVQTISQGGVTLTYTYDACGNITSVSDGTKTVSYVYDAIGQLKRVNDPFDTTKGSTGTTWVFTYDLGGNITKKKAYVYTTGTVSGTAKTTTYSYGDSTWRDKLTTIGSKTLSYDNAGNLTGDGTWTYTWQQGRQLQQMSKTGETVSFVYNGDGLRVQKTSTTKGTTNYTLHGKNVVHVTNAQNSIDMHFFYGANGRPAVVMYNGVAYGYLYNLQGDVIALVDDTGAKVVEYTYDAWGKPLSRVGSMGDTLGYWQPFRYRGYVFDQETGLYYLRSRYYRAEWGRFLNADSLIKDNLYCYCNNVPSISYDPDGYSSNSGLVRFALLHPFVALNIGRTDKDMKSKNISTTAVRFSRGLGLSDSGKTGRKGTQVNAVRHALWTGIIRSKYSEDITRQAIESHEDEQFVGMYKSWIRHIKPQQLSKMEFGDIDFVDGMCDMLNNDIALGMSIEGKTAREICYNVLDVYHTSGLWVIQTCSHGYRLYRERLSDEEYSFAIQRLDVMDDYGFVK